MVRNVMRNIKTDVDRDFYYHSDYKRESTPGLVGLLLTPLVMFVVGFGMFSVMHPSSPTYQPEQGVGGAGFPTPTQSLPSKSPRTGYGGW